MLPFKLLSAPEQVSACLREALLQGHWQGTIPGVNRLSEELGVNHKTVEAALHLLEQEGLLEGQGAGRKRRIVLPEVEATPMRIANLLYSHGAKMDPITLHLFHRLEESGHVPFHAEQTLSDLKMVPSRIRRLVERTEADAWIVGAGSREVLKWFAEQPIPAFAQFGRRGGLLLAGVGPNKPAALVEATERLLELGHERIVLLCFEERRVPKPGVSERAFLETLEAHGIRTGVYNLPQWEDSQEGLYEVLTSLFQFTPPTALIIDTPQRMFVPVREFLAQRGLRVPEDVSLVCTDDSPTFAWSNPSSAHITWDHRPVVRRIVRWVDNISQGREDQRQTLTKATFVDGGTIGPAR